MHDRFYIAGPPGRNIVELDRTQSRHVTKALRKRRGDVVTLFDGRGVEYDAEIIAPVHVKTKLQIIERREVSRELPCRITLAIAPPRAGLMDEIVRQATELGVSSILPVYCRRSVARYPNFPQKLEKWHRIIVEACKQCGRNLLPEIAQPCLFENALEDLPEGAAAVLMHTGDESEPLKKVLDKFTSPKEISLFIGPEGGFDPEEVTLTREKAVHIARLFPQTLRVETAVLAALTALAYHCCSH